MAKIEIRCTDCGHEARVPEAFRGKKVRCLRCRAKLRVPGELAPGADPGESQRPRGGRPGESAAGASAAGGGSKVRREVQQSIREVLGDYEHALESTPRGFDVDLRGVAMGLARTLAEDLLQAPGVRDVKLSGGTGECRLTITVEGATFDPADSFADDDDETELFRRPSSAGPAPFDEKTRGPGDSSGGGRRPTAKSDDRSSPSTSASRKKAPPVPDPTSAASRPRPDPASSSGPVRARVEKGAGSELDRLTAEGEKLLEDGDARRAAEVLEEVVTAERNHERAVGALGQAYARLGDSERARRAFRHLSKLRPDDPESLILHAAASVQCDRLEDARQSLADAIKLDPENARAYKYAAVLYERLGDPERSKKFRAKYEALKGR